jgi:uncharacterized membrane protein YkvA (DUF1232 family)
MWWRLAVACVAGFLLLYLVLLGLLWRYARRHPETINAHDVLRLLPDLVRLVRRLAADSTVPRTVRVRLVLLLLYLLIPIDVMPDFIPVIGYADDAIVPRSRPAVSHTSSRTRSIASALARKT